jgi:hypothetical protein
MGHKDPATLDEVGRKDSSAAPRKHFIQDPDEKKAILQRSGHRVFEAEGTAKAGILKGKEHIMIEKQEESPHVWTVMSMGTMMPGEVVDKRKGETGVFVPGPNSSVPYV